MAAAQIAVAQPTLLPPIFSVSPGFYEEAIHLNVVHPQSDVEIWFTTDGSNPVKLGQISDTALLFAETNSFFLEPRELDSLAGTGVRTNPVETDSRGFGWKLPNLLPAAHTIRAVVKYPSGMISPENHGTWFIGIAEPDLPVISLITDKNYLFDDGGGIYVPGTIYNENGYGAGFWGGANANYHQRGEEWERAAQFEYYVDGNRVLAQQVGLRIHGGGSRALPMKSLRVYARSEYGVSTLDYPFFGPGNDNSFKRLLLRNSGQDFAFNPTMFRDGAIQQIGRTLNVITQDFQPTLVYINGEFWGIHNIRERYDHHFFERRAGIEQPDLDFLTFYGGVQEGDATAFNELDFYFRNLDFADNDAYKIVMERMDIQNFIDYKLLNIHFANLDWPGNNVDYFRYRGEPDLDHPYKDGRFRWVVYDMDGGFEHADKDMLTHATEAGNEDWPNPDWSTIFLRQLLENERFKNAFIHRYLSLLNTIFQPDYIINVVNEREQAISTSIPYHIARWRYPETMSEWLNNTQTYRDFAVNRRPRAKEHLEDFFDIDVVNVTIEAPQKTVNYLLVNGRKLDYDQKFWNLYHLSEEPLTIQVISTKEYRFVGWKFNGEFIADSSILQLHPDDDVHLSLEFDYIASSQNSELIHYWFFDDSLPNNTALYTIESWFSRDITGTMSYQPVVYSTDETNSTAGIMDRVNDPTDVNFIGQTIEVGTGTASMRGIRVRNPTAVLEGDTLRKASLQFDAPTSGFRDVSFSFAAKRTASGQEFLYLWYATDSGKTWRPYFASDVAIPVPESDYGLFRFDFNDIPEASNNDDFALRITFGGETITGNEGNVRFNNIAMHGYDMSVSVEEPQVPRAISLLGNYPNPFNPSTVIRYQLPQEAHVRLTIFDTVGRNVATLVNERVFQGSHQVVFDASGLSSGVYVYRFDVDGVTSTGKMMLIR
jgi:hypothetical protein